jgi:hypothetical protein
MRLLECKVGNPNHDERGRFASGGESNGNWETAQSNQKQQYKIGKYRIEEIDAQLDPKQIDRLNAIPNAAVGHTCAGHPEGTGSGVQPGSQGGRNASFAFEVTGELSRNPTSVAEKYQNIRSPDTTVEISAWGGPNGAWNVWDTREGGWRDKSIFNGRDPKDYPIERVSVNIRHTGNATDSNLQDRHAWWDRTIDKLEKVSK